MNRLFVLLYIFAAFFISSCQDFSAPSDSSPIEGTTLGMVEASPVNSMMEEGRDEQSVICEAPDAAGSDCAEVMRFLYCGARLPVIYQDHWYTQTEATAECLAGHPPFYPDIIDCLEPLDRFVQCLADRGWGPEATETFSVRDWDLQNEMTQGLGIKGFKIQALNLFTYNQLLYGGSVAGEDIVLGAVVSRFPKTIGLAEVVILNSCLFMWLYTGIGESASFSEEAISVPINGYYFYQSLGGNHFEGPKPNLITFTPIN